MQHLLTQDELDALVPKADLEKSVTAIELMWHVMGKHGLLNCINADGVHLNHYCDECPLSGLGESPSGFRMYRMACTKPRSYSK